MILFCLFFLLGGSVFAQEYVSVYASQHDIETVQGAGEREVWEAFLLGHALLFESGVVNATQKDFQGVWQLRHTISLNPPVTLTEEDVRVSHWAITNLQTGNFGLYQVLDANSKLRIKRQASGIIAGELTQESIRLDDANQVHRNKEADSGRYMYFESSIIWVYIPDFFTGFCKILDEQRVNMLCSTSKRGENPSFKAFHKVPQPITSLM